MYDMTPLTRLEISGQGALAMLERLTTGKMDKSIGSVTYTLALNDVGGVRSDITVARLSEDTFQVGANGNLDLDYFRRQSPRDGSVSVRDITGATCCIGLWGPRARDLVQALSLDDFSNDAVQVLPRQAGPHRRRPRHGDAAVLRRRTGLGALHLRRQRTAAVGRAVGRGPAYDVIAGGRAAFNSLRMEKGYRSWGTDMTTEHNPYEAGLGFAVRPQKGDFIGRDALAGRVRRDRLPTAGVSDNRRRPIGRAGTRAGVRRRIARGLRHQCGVRAHRRRTDRLRVAARHRAVSATSVEIQYFDRRIAATVVAEPSVDPEMKKIRS